MEYSRILLIATRQIGDVLLVTPLLRSLRCAYPKAVIDVLVYENKGGMLEGNPDYNQLISVAEHPSIGQYKTLLQNIFRHYDLAISTLSGDRPLIYALLAAPWRISIVPKARWQDQWKRWIVQAWTELDNEATHTVIQNLRLTDLLTIPRCYEMVLPHSSSAPISFPSQAFIVIHLLPMWSYKRWTLKGWRQLMEYFIEKGLHIVLTGGSDPQEMEYIQKVLTHMPKTVINLAGQLRFSEVVQLIQASQLYVGPDTAVTHLAAATGTLTVALYGPTNPLKWAPWPHQNLSEQTPFQGRGTQRVGNVLLIQAPGACVPCHQEGCERHKKSKSLCLEALESETVIEEIERFKMLKIGPSQRDDGALF